MSERSAGGPSLGVAEPIHDLVRAETHKGWAVAGHAPPLRSPRQDEVAFTELAFCQIRVAAVAGLIVFRGRTNISHFFFFRECLVISAAELSANVTVDPQGAAQSSFQIGEAPLNGR
jgi:hypothetical protein